MLVFQIPTKNYKNQNLDKFIIKEKIWVRELSCITILLYLEITTIFNRTLLSSLI